MHKIIIPFWSWLTIISIAHILSDHGFIENKYVDSWYSIIASTCIVGIIWIINFFRVPSIMDKRLRNIIKEKEKILTDREKKDEIVEELSQILNECQFEDPNAFLNIGTELYQKALRCLEDSPVIPRKDIEIFKDEYLLRKTYPQHGHIGKIRILFLKDVTMNFSSIQYSKINKDS